MCTGEAEGTVSSSYALSVAQVEKFMVPVGGR